MSESQDRIKFDYIKSNLFRTAHANGMVSGINGQGEIVLNFYSERTAIPKTSVHVLKDGRLAEEIFGERVERDAMVREIEISISMNLAVARSIEKMLGTQIQVMENEIKKQRTL